MESLNQLYNHIHSSEIKPEFKKAQEYYQLMLDNAESWKTYIQPLFGTG